ncbi:MAG: hypothetical protein [Malazfec virus 1]
MKNDFNVYTARNGNKYIQTTNSYLAHGVRYLTGVQFYKIQIEGSTIHSFIYTEELLNLFNTLQAMKKVCV